MTLSAQTGSVILEGTVWDPAGNLFPGAVLTAVQEESGREFEAVSDENGHYRFLALPPGQYSVTLKAKGFKNVMRRSIALLMPGTVEQVFTIEAAAIDEDLSTYETTRIHDSENSGALSQEELLARPLIDRNPLSQVMYQPGVQIDGGNEGRSTVNGTRPAMNSVVMDGISVADPVNPSLDSSVVRLNPEIVSEIQIVTSGGKAEYGRSGGGQFVVLSRPGSKSWSGTAYDYFRNTNLNANDFFVNAAGLPRPSMTRNIFGAVVSGPVFKDKTLLFANFEGNRDRRQVSRNRLVLTPEAKAGIFRWTAPNDRDTVRSFDIGANDPLGLGIDPAVASILSALPSPNNTLIGDGLNTGGFSFNNSTYLEQERVAARIDHELNAGHRLFLRMNWDRTDGTDVFSGADAPFPNQPSGTIKQSFWGVTVGSNWTINPRMVNELRIGFLRPKTDLNRDARSAGPMLLANSWTNPLDPSFPRSQGSRVFEIADSMSHGKGSHVFKYGVDYRRVRLETVDFSGTYPNVTFDTGFGNAPSSAVGPSEQLEISTRDRQTFERLYNDLLGRIESVGQTFNSSLTTVFPAGTPRERAFTSNEFSGFIQDDWRIRSNLTLNLGLRFELSSVPKEVNGFQSVLDQSFNLDSALTDLRVASGDSWYRKGLRGLAPRAGFAWDVFGTGGTVLRGGYGIFYDRLIGAVTNLVDASSYGFSQTATVFPNAEGTETRLSNGIPEVPQPLPPELDVPLSRSTSIAIFDPELRAPRIDQFNLMLEQRLGGAIFEVGYVGTRGRNLFQYLNLNQTKTQGEFLAAFRQLQAYRDLGMPIPETNPFLQVFGSPGAALDAVGGFNVDANRVGLVADIMDKGYFGNYAAAGVPDTLIRNFPQFDKFIVGTSTGKSWYNSLQAGFRASGRTYHMRAYYTWSKSIDTLSSDGDALVTPTDSFQRLGRAPSDFDRTHVFNFAWDQRLPFGRSWSLDSQIPRWADAVFGDWSFAILWVKESGRRFSVFSGAETVYAGTNSYADYEGSHGIGRIQKQPRQILWFLPEHRALFSVPGAGSLGSSGRNSFVGPSYSNVDMALYKSFAINERQNVQLRIEAYNLFNRAHFGIPDGDISSPTFGRITSTVGTPRSLQVALRYRF